jgi:hypothetical protein
VLVAILILVSVPVLSSRMVGAGCAIASYARNLLGVFLHVVEAR